MICPNDVSTPGQWARVGCTANYLCVDEGPSHDGDATYVHEDIHLESDQYAFQDVSGSGTVASVTVSAVARDIPFDPCVPAGTCPIHLQLLVNGFASTPKLLGSSYETLSHTWTTNPATGQPWTVAEVNALQAGVRKYDLSASVDSETRVTQVYVTVFFSGSTTYAYDNGPTGTNGLLSIAGSRAATFTHNANGDLETRTEGGVTWSYAYNGMGLLREVKEGSTVRATYAYDGLGRRVKAAEAGVTTYFVYGVGLDPIWEKAGTTETRHVYANGMRIARMIVGGSTYTYHTDALGSTWRMTDASKGVVFSTSYEPFGRSWGTAGSLASSERYRFLGERNDTESGLTYLRARQYDPTTGRFTSLDPVLGALSAPQTLNRYPYAVNNPARYTDPTGAFIVGLLAVFLLGAVVLPGTVCAAVSGDLDCAMMALGTIPILGDIVASTYFLIKDLNACFGWWEDEDRECSPGMIGLDLLGFLPLVPSLGAAAHLRSGARAISSDYVADFSRLAGRTIGHFEGKRVLLGAGDIKHIIRGGHVTETIQRLGLRNVDELQGVLADVLRTGRRVTPGSALPVRTFAVESPLYRGFWVVLDPKVGFYRLRTFYAW